MLNLTQRPIDFCELFVYNKSVILTLRAVFEREVFLMVAITQQEREELRELRTALDTIDPSSDEWSNAYARYEELSFKEHEQYKAESLPKLKEFYNEHISGKTFDTVDEDDWDFYSDFHKDVFGYRPRGFSFPNEIFGDLSFLEASEPVKAHIKKEIDRQFPSYELVNAWRKNNIADDNYLFSVLAHDRKSNKYTVWTAWNESSQSLNHGHYMLTEQEAREVLCDNVSSNWTLPTVPDRVYESNLKELEQLREKYKNVYLSDMCKALSKSESTSHLVDWFGDYALYEPALNVTSDDILLAYDKLKTNDSLTADKVQEENSDKYFDVSNGVGVKHTISLDNKKNSKRSKKEYTAQEKAEWKEQAQKHLSDMVDKLNEGIQMVFDSERYKSFMAFWSGFHSYSFRNTLLIMLQNPKASVCAGFNKWKEVGRNVKKGEKGLTVLAPIMKKVEVERKNPETEEKEKDIEKIMLFKPVKVFDVSQTEGKELPNLCTELTGSVEQKELILKGLEEATGIPFEYEAIDNGAKGYFSPSQQKVVIKEGMDDLHTIKTAVHESAHALFDNPQSKFYDKETAHQRDTKELRAESVAFIVCNALGLDTSDYSFDYVTSWSEGKSLQDMKLNLEVVGSGVEHLESHVNKYVKLFASSSDLDTVATLQAENVSASSNKKPMSKNNRQGMVL